MSEPQIKNTIETQATSPSAEEINRGEEPTAPPSAPPTTTTTTTTNTATTELTGDVKTLKDAFPDLDVEIIEAILDSQGGNLDATFEVLLGMSDPSYKPTPSEIAQHTQSQNQLREDEEYARRLAREGDAHYPQHNTNTDNQPLFNFQEELPIIKEKVIEAGTAAKNKIMNLYNQFMANQNNESSSGGGGLASGMGNLSLSDNNRQPQHQQQQRPHAPPQDPSVDLYEWDGQGSTPVRNPLLAQQNVTSSTPSNQLLSDEEFARQLAKEDAEAAAAAAAVAEVAHNNHSTSPHRATDANDSDNGEVTFSALNDHTTKPDTTKPTGYAIHDDDDLDDLFDKQDSTADLKGEEVKTSVTTPKN